MLVQPNGVVNGQSYYSNWRFGAQTFDYNGCGVIATYNVMVLLGRNPSLAQVTYDIESGHGALAWGYLGTDPLHPYKYFQDNGIKVEQYLTYNNFNKSFVNMQMSQYAMICFWNNKNDIRDGAHFVAVQKISENKFAVYNYISNRQTIFYKTSLADIIGQGRFMSGLIIN